jgi:hypothetical protein
MTFWAGQPFDLRIPAGAGNCVGCFMKGVPQLLNVFADDPLAAARWIAREEAIGARVRKDRPPYRELVRLAERQPRLPLGGRHLPLLEADHDDEALPCACAG